MSKASQRKLSLAQKSGKVTNKTTDDVAGVFDEMGKDLWSQVDSVHNECLAVTTLPHTVVPLLSNEAYLDTVKDKVKLEEDAKLLLNDMKSANEMLTQIHNKHSDKSGDAKSIDDFTLGLMVLESYNEWMANYQDSVVPKQKTVLEHFVNETLSDDLESPVVTEAKE